MVSEHCLLLQTFTLSFLLFLMPHYHIDFEYVLIPSEMSFLLIFTSMLFNYSPSPLSDPKPQMHSTLSPNDRLSYNFYFSFLLLVIKTYIFACLKSVSSHLGVRLHVGSSHIDIGEINSQPTGGLVRVFILKNRGMNFSITEAE